MSNIYQGIVDQMFLEQYEERSGDGFLHPSSLSGCWRQAVYDASGTERTDAKDVRNIRIMGNGTAFHDKIQAYMHRTYPGFLSEVEVECGPVIGSADGLLPTQEGYGYTVDAGAESPYTRYELQEYKSISPMGKRYLKGRSKPEHVTQARVYAWALERQGYLIDGIRIVYFDRDDWSVEEFEVPAWAPEEAAVFESEMHSAEVHLEEGTLPDRLPLDEKGNRAWLCRYCQYQTRCYEVDGDNERG